MATEPGKELLWKYAFGQCEPHEISFVEAWLKSDPENQKVLDRIRLYESIDEAKGGSQLDGNEKMVELKEEKQYANFVIAIIIILIVFILLFIYSLIKN
jgi:hypothetical protein